MKRINLQQNTEEWLQWRKAKITGSRISDIEVKRGTGKKIGFWKLLAERLSTDTTKVDNPMERGHELEVEAIRAFEEETGYKVNEDCGVWVSDVNEYIALSPDGEINDEWAVEVKCPAESAYHVQTFVENKIPDQYEAQVIQYFVVNEKLERLYFISYDPRIACKPLHIITVEREDIADRIEYLRDYQLNTLQEIDDLVAKYTF